MAQPLWKTDMVFPSKVKHRITGYDPGISRHPNVMEAGTQADTCATTVYESITHNDPTGDTTQMSINREQVNKMGSTRTVASHPALGSHEILRSAITDEI